MKKRYILLILILLGILLFTLIPLLIKIEKVTCKTQYGDCNNLLVNELEGVKNKNLISSRSQVKKVVSKNHFISDYSIHFNLPNTLKVDLILRKPIYSIRKENTDDFILVSREGLVLSSSKQSDLPTLNVNYDLAKVGETISEKEMFALNLLLGVDNMYQINRGLVKDESLVVELPDAINVIFPLEGYDRDFLLGSLRLIYSKIQKEQGSYKELDLRFKNPVLR